MISLAKAAADPAGHYARPDVTRLLLEQDAGRPRGGARHGRPSELGPDDEPRAVAPRNDLAEAPPLRRAL